MITNNGDRIESTIKAFAWTLTDGSISPAMMPGSRPIQWREDWATDEVTDAFCARMLPCPENVNSLYEAKCFIAHMIVGCALGKDFKPTQAFGIYERDGQQIFARHECIKYDDLEHGCLMALGHVAYFETVMSLIYELHLPNV